MESIQAEFAGKTWDEIEDMSNVVNLEDLLRDDPDFVKHPMPEPISMAVITTVYTIVETIQAEVEVRDFNCVFCITHLFH